MFTMVQTMDLALEIQADHRRRAARWRFARRHRRADAAARTDGGSLAPVVRLPRTAASAATSPRGVIDATPRPPGAARGHR